MNMILTYQNHLDLVNNLLFFGFIRVSDKDGEIDYTITLNKAATLLAANRRQGINRWLCMMLEKLRKSEWLAGREGSFVNERTEGSVKFLPKKNILNYILVMINRNSKGRFFFL